MEIKKYPILRIYTDAINKLQKQSDNLALIFLIGGTCELFLREIMNDEKTGMERLIRHAENNKKINLQQAELFDDIRACRNKYLHINSDKILDDYRYFYVKDDLLENVNEIVLNDFDEKNLEKVARTHILKDSEFIYTYFKELVKSFS